jgi:hypothetical protein
MREPRRLTTLWASTACYRDSFSFAFLLHEVESFWETDSRPASFEILRLLYDWKVHYRVHKSSPMHPILSQLNPADIHTPYLDI